jgi:HK97 family phage prohead protease
MRVKALKLDVLGITDEGTFEGHAAAFHNTDSYGDVIEPGAFKRTLDHWRTKGKPIPILWQHNPYEPIGHTLEASEDEKGLAVKGQLILGVQKAREAYELMKAEVLGGLSIGYDTVKDRVEGRTRFLKELKLYEYSVVTWPANERATYGNLKHTPEQQDVIGALLDVLALEELTTHLKNGHPLPAGTRRLVGEAIRTLSALQAFTPAEADPDNHSDEAGTEAAPEQKSPEPDNQVVQTITLLREFRKGFAA